MRYYRPFFSETRVPRPEAPTRCKCGSKDFRWDPGFKGSQMEPPEPSSWYCAECETRDFQDCGEEE